MPDQKQIWTRCLGGFSVMWVTKILISPVKKRILCPKTTKFGPNLAFLVNLGQAMQAYSMPCCGSVGGCGARAVSRKTPIYFMTIVVTAGIIFKSRAMIPRTPTVLTTAYPWGGRSAMIPWYFLWSFLSFMGNSLSEFHTAAPCQFQNIFADTEGKKAISGKVTDEKSIYVWSPFLRHDSFVLGTKKNSSSACSAAPQNCFNWEKMVQK